MKLTIDTEVLSQNNLTLGEFLILLLGFYNYNFEKYYNALIDKKTIGRNIFCKTGIIMSDNSKALVQKVLVDSDSRIKECGIDFQNLAKKIQEIYPQGNKAGTTYSWRGTTEEIVQKLKNVIVIHDFLFTEQEAMDATAEYVSSFEDKKCMSILKNFILKTYEEEDGNFDIKSMFMTIIENNRNNNL